MAYITVFASDPHKTLAFKEANFNNVAIFWISYLSCFQIWKKLGHLLNEGFFSSQ